MPSSWEIQMHAVSLPHIIRYDLLNAVERSWVPSECRVWSNPVPHMGMNYVHVIMKQF